jgi:hypothetical protein
MSNNFNVYKWKHDYLLSEDLNKYQSYPKDKIGEYEYVFLPKKQSNGGIELFKTSDVNFDSIPDEIMFTGTQYSVDAKKTVPIFLFTWNDYKSPESKEPSLTPDEYNRTSGRYQGD